MYKLINSCLDKMERCLNFLQPDVFKVLHVWLSVFCGCRVTTDRKNRIILCYVFYLTKMLLNTVLNSATARQFHDTIFKILRVLQYCISSILSQSVQNIRLIGCYLLPGHQEVVEYLYSLAFTMQSSTTARQTSNCMQIITYHVTSFRTKYSMSDSLVLP